VWVTFCPTDHHPRTQRQRDLRTERGLAVAAENGDPFLRIRVGVRVGGLVRSEALEGEVVVRSRRDGNPSEPRGTQLDEILRGGAEDPEVVQDLRQIADRMVHPARQ